MKFEEFNLHEALMNGIRDAGFEVIYTGCHQTPEQIAAAAIQEDVDIVGLSCLSGAHRYLFPAVVTLLKDKGADDITVIGGGIIPDQDFKLMFDAGLKAIFPPFAYDDERCFPFYELAERYRPRFAFLDEFLENYRRLAADFREAAHRLNGRLAFIEQ